MINNFEINEEENICIYTKYYNNCKKLKEIKKYYKNYDGWFITYFLNNKNNDIQQIKYVPHNFLNINEPEEIIYSEKYIQKNWTPHVSNKFISITYFKDTQQIYKTIELFNNNDHHLRLIKYYNNDDNSNLIKSEIFNTKTHDIIIVHYNKFNNNKYKEEYTNVSTLKYHRENDKPAIIKYFDYDESIKSEKYFINGEYKRTNNENPTIIKYSENGDERIDYYTDVKGNIINKIYNCGLFTKCMGLK